MWVWDNGPWRPSHVETSRWVQPWCHTWQMFLWLCLRWTFYQKRLTDMSIVRSWVTSLRSTRLRIFTEAWNRGHPFIRLLVVNSGVTFYWWVDQTDNYSLAQERVQYYRLGVGFPDYYRSLLRQESSPGGSFQHLTCSWAIKEEHISYVICLCSCSIW